MLTVWKLDRLGRSLRDLIALLDDLKALGVAFRSLTEAIDTETPTGRAMWQMVGILAELERSLIQERTKGLRRILGLTQQEFAARYHIPLGTLRDWEQGRTEPDQPARAYLTVIARDPEGVRRALTAQPA